jgi:hypothetical protein
MVWIAAIADEVVQVLQVSLMGGTAPTHWTTVSGLTM